MASLQWLAWTFPWKGPVPCVHASCAKKEEKTINLCNKKKTINLPEKTINLPGKTINLPGKTINLREKQLTSREKQLISEEKEKQWSATDPDD